jgi:hypothetical protein
MPVYHPCHEDLSLGTPVYHPCDKDLSLGTPVYHPCDEDPSLGTPVCGTLARQAPASPEALMPRRSLLYAILLAASLIASPAALDAQQPATSPPPVNHTPSTHVNGIGIPEVAGLPFSATVVIENERLMRDGSALTRRTINLIARDSRGRIHNEVRRLMPESFHGSPQLMEVRLFDPQTRMRTIYYPDTHLAHQQVLPIQPKVAGFPNPWVSVDDLGTTTLNGLEAKGTRRTFTVSASASGTGEPVDVVDEFWYSQELHLNLLVHHTDPRSGEQTVGISGIKREEPPAAMFELPLGYKIVDVTPPLAPASVSASPPVSDPMTDEIP